MAPYFFVDHNVYVIHVYMFMSVLTLTFVSCVCCFHKFYEQPHKHKPHKLMKICGSWLCGKFLVILIKDKK